MIRLNVVVEGQTEEGFVAGLLAPHLASRGIVTAARCVTCGRKHGVVFKGGLPSYAVARRDLWQWLREDRGPDARFTTMFDLYALPHGFPGFKETQETSDCQKRIFAIEESLSADLADRRFIPYLQLHEFEALLFSDPGKFAVFFPHHEAEIIALSAVAAQFAGPEDIDDGPETAPSKRIGQQLPAYLKMKAAAGPQIAAAIGLPAIRAKCPHFNQWLTTLENLK